VRNALDRTSMFERGLDDYEACNEALRRICGAYQVAAERWWEFRGSIETRKAGSLDFADVAFSGGRVLRDRDDRHYRGDHFFLILQAGGSARMRQRGAEASLGPGDCTLIDSRFPSAFEVGPGFHQYSFHLPARQLADRFGARTLPFAPTIRADRGAGALLSQLLATAIRNASTLAGVELTGMTLDLLAVALGVGSDHRTPLHSERRTPSLHEVAQFIDASVHTAELSPAAIAAHFNTSVRRLYRLVGAAGWTPASLIWSRRLERARELLAQEGCRAPIIEIALMCGFKDGAHFSRAYRKAFGHPPKVARSLSSANAGNSQIAVASGTEPFGSDAADSAWRTRSTDAGSKSGTRRMSRVQMRA